jgi:hypothetical protein
MASPGVNFTLPRTQDYDRAPNTRVVQDKHQAHAMHARSSKTDYPGPPLSRSSGWPGLLLLVALLDVPRSGRSPALKSEASSFLIYILACLIFHILATLVQYIFYAFTF